MSGRKDSKQKIHFVKGPKDLKTFSDSFKSAKTKRKTRRRSGKSFLSPAFEVPAELLAAKQKLIDEVLGGNKEWAKAHDEGKKGGKLGLENITSVYIGQKRSGPGKGKPTPELCVVIEVLTKADKAKLHRDFTIPEKIKVGNQYVLTDIQVGKQVKPQSVIGGDFCGLNRPNPAGKFEAGTIGCFCTILDGAGERWGCLLTNSHVIGKYLGAGVQENDEILHKNGPNGKHIGYYFKSGPTGVDAALAFTKGSAVDLGSHHGLEIVSGLRDPTSGDTVLTYGAKTGKVRHGTVVKTGITTTVPYPNVGTKVIEDVFTIQGAGGAVFSQPGDSGSLITDEGTSEPVGLLIGAMGSLTVAHRIGFVCSELDVEGILATK